MQSKTDFIIWEIQIKYMVESFLSEGNKTEEQEGGPFLRYQQLNSTLEQLRVTLVSALLWAGNWGKWPAVDPFHLSDSPIPTVKIQQWKSLL